LFWRDSRTRSCNGKPGNPTTLHTALAWFLGCGFQSILPSHSRRADRVRSANGTADGAKFRQWVTDLHCGAASNGQAAQLEIQRGCCDWRFPCRRVSAMPRVPCPTPSSRLPVKSRRSTGVLHRAALPRADDRQPDRLRAGCTKLCNDALPQGIRRHHHRFPHQAPHFHAQRFLSPRTIHHRDSGHSGFQSLSRFNEAFKLACGCPPAAFATHTGAIRCRELRMS